jgi:hypothetical protein
MATPLEPIHIRVVGDIVVDRHFYHSETGGVFEKAELGGAAGLTRLLDESIKAKEALRKAEEEAKEKQKGTEKAAESKGTPEPKPPITIALGLLEPSLARVPPSHNAYAVWAPHKQDSRKTPPRSGGCCGPWATATWETQARSHFS